ncbi:MAG TPA: molybdopterin converting factor subunit 1 [Rhizomicrobium sp.]|nr:molybdopterin converting factor subunit 1 [Rhizomicrobium sp.]
MTLLYFAWLRQKLGKSEERMALPPGVADVRGLIAHLRQLGPDYAEAFGDESRLRVAVNQRHACFGQAIATHDEIAFFPPVTGG